ncbi:hypothetical protein SELMODRAFT_428740 [Selaginella moellendorffii]|uniref:Uncharacterized protein n=1 Tax=Selaginella moellendorffii TaxID=88036 RepID=D8T3U4_SELML|nr:hypothetical protein SELMODRAFT_428740 [Selaginella moellendorffii]
MEIPALQWKDAEEATMDFAMFVDDASGFFKLGVHCAAATGHTGYVYDSATQAWSALGMLHFSQAYIKVRTKREELCNMNLIPTFPEMDDFYYDITTLGMYDIQRCEWSVGSVVRNLKFTTGCEGQFEAGKGEFDSHVCCVLPQPGLSTSRLWEYNGQRYFASAWVYAGVTCDRDDGVDGFGVWTVENNGSLVAVSAVRVTYTIKDPKRQYYMLQVMTAADGNLVCFSDDAPVVVYNLNTDKWCEIEPPQLTDRFNETVVYRPSLRRVA